MMHCGWFDTAELKERFNSERLFHDVAQLLKVIHQLRDAGNTLVVIDIEPGGGAGGGTVVAQGTPEAVAAVAASYTGRYLGKML